MGLGISETVCQCYPSIEGGPRKSATSKLSLNDIETGDCGEIFSSNLSVKEA